MKGSSEEMYGFAKSKKLLIPQEVFTECFQISHTAVIKAASDLRNVSTMTEVKMSIKIHTMNPHSIALTDKIIPLQTFRSIRSGNSWLWVSESVTADGRSQHHYNVFWTPTTTQDCMCLPHQHETALGLNSISRFFFSLDFTLCLIYVCLDQNTLLKIQCKNWIKYLGFLSIPSELG